MPAARKLRTLQVNGRSVIAVGAIELRFRHGKRGNLLCEVWAREDYPVHVVKTPKVRLDCSRQKKPY